MKFLSWMAKIYVEEGWVADGFELTQERLKSMIEREISGSYPNETRVEILKAPTAQTVAKTQGNT